MTILSISSFSLSVTFTGKPESSRTSLSWLAHWHGLGRYMLLLKTPCHWAIGGTAWQDRWHSGRRWHYGPTRIYGPTGHAIRGTALLTHRDYGPARPGIYGPTGHACRPTGHACLYTININIVDNIVNPLTIGSFQIAIVIKRRGFASARPCE